MTPHARPLHISFGDSGGGANIAASRLHSAQRANGIESRLLVLRKSTQDPHTLAFSVGRIANAVRRRQLPHERPDKHTYPRYDGRTWSVGRVTMPLADYTAKLMPPPDVIHLHWVGNGMLSVGEIARFKTPIVWTLHDMWALTGGCHYAADCTRYSESCGRCPALGSTRDEDLSRHTFNAKARAWRDLSLTLVTPSLWLAQCVRESALLRYQRLEVIPNPIDIHTFKPLDKTHARAVFNLPTDKKLVLFSAMYWGDRYKGYHHLVAALKHLRGRDDLALVTVGQGDSTPLTQFGLPLYHVGLIQDARLMALLYAAADVLVVPSEQDNLPNAVMEALACGTPTAAFRIGGIPDMVEHTVTGYLAPPFDARALADGIVWLTDDADRAQHLSTQARHRACERYAAEVIAMRYATLYADVCLGNDQI